MVQGIPSLLCPLKLGTFKIVSFKILSVLPFTIKKITWARDIQVSTAFSWCGMGSLSSLPDSPALPHTSALNDGPCKPNLGCLVRAQVSVLGQNVLSCLGEER